MSFELFGFDYYKGDGYGFWIGTIETIGKHRSLFCLYNNMGEWQLTICYFRLI